MTEETAYEKNKQAYVLIKIKPKYAVEFCIMMIACKELCKIACKELCKKACKEPYNTDKFKKLAKIVDVFSVFGPFDFLLRLKAEGNNEIEENEQINKTVFKIRENLGSYIHETCTLIKFDLSISLGEDSKILLNKARSFEKKNIENCNLSTFNTFLKENGAFDKIEVLQKELNCITSEIENLWHKNKPLFNLEEDYKKYLKNGIVDVNLREIINSEKKIRDHKNFLSDKAELFKIDEKDEKNWQLTDEVNRYGIYDTGTELKVYRIKTKDVHVLIRVKPLYTEKFFIGMTLFKSLCNRSDSLAIIDTFSPVLGPYDFLLELSVVGNTGEEKEKKINTTILKIREILGGYINETISIKKFKIPLKKKELEEHFCHITGEKHLPGRNGEKIPDESSDDICDLIEVCNAEKTALKKLLKKANTSEFDNLNNQIISLTHRVEELENKKHSH